MSTRTPRFDNAVKRDFTTALNEKVNNYFTSKNISKNANAAMILKTIFFLICWIGSYCLIMFGGFSTGITYALYAFLGFSVAFSAVNIGHDAIHGAYSGKPWMNHLLSHTFNFNGASAYMWVKMHNQAHHTYTNVDGIDEDIESVPFLRLSPAKKLYKINKFQHIYGMLFYGLATITWVFGKDFIKFFKNEVGNFSGNEKHPKAQYFWLFFYKAVYYTIFIVLPGLTLGWPVAIIGFLILHYCEGFTLAIIFMLAHVVEKAHFPNPNGKNTIENSWVSHQLYTTVNFASKSKVAAFFTGGLNQQVEHHLFPHICSIHYPQLSDIVRETAEEYGLPYLEEKTFLSAVASHLRFLKEMGKKEIHEPTSMPLPVAS